MAQHQADDDKVRKNKCDECNSDNASFKCSGCKQVFYCNHKCQRIAWKSGHKTICKYSSEIQLIHKKLSSNYELSTQDRKTHKKQKLSPLQFKKRMLNVVIFWFDKDKDGGLNFNEFENMLDCIHSILDGMINDDKRWSKWCDFCKKMGFTDPTLAILKENEIWIFLLEIGDIVAKLRKKQNDKLITTGYQQAFHLLMSVWSDIRDCNVAPIPKEEICDAIISVTPFPRDITYIIHAYLSHIDAIFKIGDTKYPVQWIHDAQNTKPLHIILEKYKENKANRKQDVKDIPDDNWMDCDDWDIFSDDDDDDDDEDDDDMDDDKKENKIYEYHVSYIRDIQDVFDLNGEFAGDSDMIEISIRITDAFGVIDKDKKCTFLLGSSFAGKLLCLFGSENHAELISSVLKHHGLDLMNIKTIYIGKKLFGSVVREHNKKELVKTFNEMNGCNAKLISERIAGYLGIFSEDAYNCKPPAIQKNNNNRNNRLNIFDEMFDDIFGSIFA